jgi:hypothetical protein
MAAVPGCNSVARWNASLQGYEQYIPGIPPTNFTVQMGYPYYVNVTSNGIFTLLGELTAPTFNLITTSKTDFNEVMLPLNKTGIVKASQLISDIPNCNSVARWNATMQGYEQYIPGIPPTDFDVKVGYPYYVNVTANVTWPSGGTPKAAEPENAIAGQIDGTKAPHAVYGKLDPSGDLTGFVAYVTSRPEDRLTEVSPGCGIVEGYWIVQCASFQASWDAGETVRVEFLDNQGNTLGFTEVKLTYEPYDMAGIGVTKKPELVVTSCELFQNYPNPFNPSTNIPYQLNKPGRVRILVYNMMGQEVRWLVDETKESGVYKTYWDGKDNRNNAVGNGIYFVRMETKGIIRMRKIVFIQ